jgi:hypothetical protein
MTRIKSISIPTPCHESWQQMIPMENGRHCQSCCKTVIDFTVMTDSEIITHLGNHSNLCGRFDDFQLLRINQQLQNQPSSFTLFKRIGLAAAVLMAIPFAKANAQKKHKTEQAPVLKSHRDILTIKAKSLTAANIKIKQDSTTIKNQDLQLIDGMRSLSGTIGGITVTGITIRPKSANIWTSVLDMLREY